MPHFGEFIWLTTTNVNAAKHLKHPPFQVVSIKEPMKIPRPPAWKVNTPEVDGFDERANPSVKTA
jgi:hypothetical protein